MTATNVQESDFFGFKQLTFTFKGRQAILVCPKEPDEGKNWLLKTEYFGAFPNLEIAMLERGFHLAHVQNETRWCKPSDTEMQAAFIRWLHEEYGLAPRCTPVGMSCGGFHAVCFASRYPDYVSLLYLDAPLLSFYGWTEGFDGYEKWQNEQITAYGFRSKAEIYTHNDQPIHRLKTLTENRLPVALVYGGADKVVDPKANSEVVADFYRLENAPIKVWYKPDCDHHPHGLEDNSELIEFIDKNAL